jgi:CHAT domain-containing protein
VRTELRALRRTVAGTRVALNDAATEPALRRDIRRAGVLHVASHALVNPTAPLQNALLLHPDSSSTAADSDGVLFLHELRGRAQIPLVVLSGCNTARGPLRGGEGMEGLQYAFRALGARSTLSTLWSVADDASVDLMRSFYEHLRSGVSKDRALRRARLDYLAAHPDRASPFFWAAPVLYGSPAPVPLESPAFLPFVGPWPWGGLAVLGALLLALLWWGRDRLPGPFGPAGRRA